MQVKHPDHLFEKLHLRLLAGVLLPTRSVQSQSGAFAAVDTTSQHVVPAV